MWCLLYHRIGTGSHATPLEAMQAHLLWIKNCFSTVVPGDPLTDNSMCLTFDDATEDFYTQIYPLLQTLQLKSVLAVPVAKISTPGFCSWLALQEMQQSGLVHMANHSWSHQSLLFPFINLAQELELSKRQLEQNLSTQVKTFVYPFGHFNSHIHAQVKVLYPFIMRIGSAWNRNWDNGNQLIYRIPNDGLVAIKDRLSLKQRCRYKLYYWLNQLRNR